jgi:formiminoglutamase
MNPVIVQRGQGPVILGQPHGGTFVPDALMTRLNTLGRVLADTDWHIDQLYDGLLPDVTIVHANFHRYVVDANRDPSGGSLYPGRNTTGLCPMTDFDGLPIWTEGQAPGAHEIAERTTQFHAPYHAALAVEVERIRALHGVAIVWDCHSIRSTIPFLFDGVLPVFNIGTYDGATCDDRIRQAVLTPCQTSGLPTVINARFKGGWATRHYGQPGNGVHAIQMELAQRAYLTAESAPWTYDAKVAETARSALSTALKSLDTLARSGALTG